MKINRPKMPKKPRLLRKLSVLGRKRFPLLRRHGRAITILSVVLVVLVGGPLLIRGFLHEPAQSLRPTTPSVEAPPLEQPANSPSQSGAPGPHCVHTRAGCAPVETSVKPESDLYRQLQEHPEQIENIEFVSGTNEVVVHLADQRRYKVYAADSFDAQNMRSLAISKNVHFSSTVRVVPKSDNSFWSYVVFGLMVLSVIGAVWLTIRRRRNSQNGGNGSSIAPYTPASNTQTGNTLPSADDNSKWKRGGANSAAGGAVETLSLDDVIGQEPAKKAMRGIIKYLNDPLRVQNVGAKIPRGVLLIGPGGLGKTLLVRAAASEAGVKFLDLDGGSFLDTYVGVGSKRVKQLFADARAANGPCIIFIDEIDGLAARRSKGDDGDKGGNEAARTLGTLLTEMDGFRTGQHPHPIVVVGATNRVEALDPAVLRAGRFTRKIRFTMPKLDEVVRLFEHYGKKIALAGDVDFQECAKKSVGLPGASIENICNEAALMLVDEDTDSEEVTQAHLLAAVDAEVRQQVSTSPAKRFNPDENSVKLSDVIGQQIAKEDVSDIVDYLKDLEAFKSRGISIPKGTLFVGPPGEGKTLLARAVAGEAGVPFFSVAGSEFVEKFVGVGAQRIREVFEQAKLNAPSIVFIDEIDSIGKKRSAGMEGSDERDTTLNQLLVEMDGFGGDSRVIVLAATNRPDILDDALTRPGRFDRQATFYKPDYADRLPLLQYYFRDKLVAVDVNLDHFARNTSGFSAASIANVANEAALLAKRAGMVMITAKHIDDAITRVLIGAERKTRLMSKKEKLNVAVHEAGHAVTYHVASDGEPIARITIMPRGDSGGHVQTMNDDRFLMTDKEILVQICMALGGRAAQQMILGVTDTGASSDFQQARRLAYMYVAEYGMSDLGPLTAVQGVERSPEEKRLIEEEVGKILRQSERRALDIIKQNRINFDRLVEILLVKETILGPEFAAILAGEDVARPDGNPQLPEPLEQENAQGLNLRSSETPGNESDGGGNQPSRSPLRSVGDVIGGVLGSVPRPRMPRLRKQARDEEIPAVA